MCFLAYRLNHGARLLRYLFVISLCIFLYPDVLARAQDDEVLPEIFYVRGCRDGAAEARETRGCFAARADVRASGSKSATPITSVMLSLQGVNLPSKVQDQGNDGVQVVTHRVVLQEHRRPPLLGQEKDESHTRLLGRIVLACDQLTASPVFPTQLLSCELKNPLYSLSRVKDMGPQLRRLLGHSIWFDVHLEVRQSGEVFRTLSVLRRSVELQVSNVTGIEDETAAGVLRRQANRMSWEELRRHPLERLYPPPPTSQGSSSRSAKSTGGADDPYDRDPAASDGEVWMELGIGGLKDELLTLFRRVFLSRLPSLAPLAEALELQHVRGVILYGPPGNGKTLIARSLFRLLGPDTRLSIVNAAEILSKFIGESEKNLRDIFEGYIAGTSAKEEAAQQAGEEFDRSAHTIRGAGKKESLLVLVIDEFEALFRRRGHSYDESSAKAVYDGVTNTLLSLMDGVQSRNDILVVGLTNRLSAIDAALLRPGRFEVLIEIPPPDTPGREDIFFIHTERLREQNLLASDVVMRGLALESGGFSGSDIAGTVRSAISHALLRYRKDDFFQGGLQARGGGDQASSETDDAGIIGHRSVDVDGTRVYDPVESVDATSTVSPPKFQVTMEDFERAIRDIRSAKEEGSLFSELSSDADGFARDLIDHDGTVSRNIERATFLFERVMQSNRTQSGMLAITGGPGSGKSMLARALTQLHNFTTVRYFPCRRLVELPNHEEKLVKLRDAFSEASQTERGILVLDDYDVLVDVMGSDGHSAHALRGLLYDYMNHPQGVRRTSAVGSRVATADQAEGEVDGGTMIVNAGRRVAAGRRHRVLVVTSSLSSALHQLSFDARLHVHPVLRSRAAALLQTYRVVAPALTAKAAAAYPVSMSYRTFLRVTDISLQQWVRGYVDDTTAVNGDSSVGDSKMAGSRRELPAFFATSVSTPAAYEEMQAKQVAGNFYALQDDAACRSFVAAVRTTVNHMGLMDPYQGWGGGGSDDAGSSVGGADGRDREGEETVDVDELVGVADELLW